MRGLPLPDLFENQETLPRGRVDAARTFPSVRRSAKLQQAACMPVYRVFYVSRYVDIPRKQNRVMAFLVRLVQFAAWITMRIILELRIILRNQMRIIPAQPPGPDVQPCYIRRRFQNFRLYKIAISKFSAI